ncbi:MAG: L-threo-3-hydroxyaspartate ammonia-lyase [Ktedonobacterales bacterium]|jgi:threonine dehydratase|nr:MAG: L-threo-3-hydroxyaspartate ammonia-lyase [Ktedonobacterales bacterium]
MTASSEQSQTEPLAITMDDIYAAAERIEGQAHRTPVHTSRDFNAAAGQDVWFKCESFQRGGAFKFRGAYNKIASLPAEQRARGVIAFSSGNHAQAVALCGRIFGVPAVICMPTDAPIVKVEATRGYGAEIVFYDRMTEDREALAQRLSTERGLTLVPPYNDPAIIAGQGTAALELLTDVPDLDVIAAPVGGGGLISGTSVAAHALRPGIAVVGVETEAGNHAYLAKLTGERVTIPPPDTIADGIRTAALGTLTWPIVHETVDEVVLVSEDEVREAMRFLALRLKLVVEPTGAVPAAAALSGKLRRYGPRAGVILSGGNVAPETLAAVLTGA